MDAQLMFTPADLITCISAIAAFIISINAAAVVVISWHKKMHQPEVLQNEKIKALEERVKLLEASQNGVIAELNAIKTSFKEVEAESRKFQRIMVRGLQALSEHAIDGNNTEQLLKAIDALNDYMLEKM